MSPESDKSPVKTESKEPKTEEKSPKSEPKDESVKTELIETGNEVKPEVDAEINKEEKKDNDVAENNCKAEVKTLPVKR